MVTACVCSVLGRSLFRWTLSIAEPVDHHHRDDMILNSNAYRIDNVAGKVTDAERERDGGGGIERERERT